MDEWHAAQRIQVQAGDESEHFMSFSPRNPGIDGTICFSVEDEFEMLFVEPPNKKPGETASFEIPTVGRPLSSRLTVSTIPVAISPSVAMPWFALIMVRLHLAYFKLRESRKAVKARI